jgi:hypothetical protein
LSLLRKRPDSKKDVLQPALLRSRMGSSGAADEITNIEMFAPLRSALIESPISAIKTAA